MKLIPIVVMFLMIANPSFADEKNDKENVKQTIIKIFDLVAAGKSNDLAEYIVYRGDDENRKWKDYCRYDNPDEKNQVQNIHQRIADRYLPSKYAFVKFQTQKESEGEWLVWEMEFITNEIESTKVYFAFLKVDGKYLLGDID